VAADRHRDRADRTTGILGELEVAIRRELGADRIPLKTVPPEGSKG
jgi:hypothetical protein